MRWTAIWLLATVALAACGDEGDEPGARPADAGSHAEIPPPDPEPAAPPAGTPERGGWELRQVIRSVDPEDPESLERALARVQAIREEYAGSSAELDALVLMAKISLDMRRPKAAAEAHLAAEKLLPPEMAPAARIEAVRAYHLAGEYDRCLELLDELEGVRVMDWVERAIPMERAAALLALGRSEEGLAVYRKEAAAWGDTAPGRAIRLTLAVTLARLGRDAEARKVCEGLWPRLRLEAEGVDAGMILADVLERAGEVTAAREILETVGRVAESELADAARARLQRMALTGEPMPELPIEAIVPGGERAPGRGLVVVFWDPARPDSVDAVRGWAEAVRDSSFDLVGVALGTDRDRVHAATKEHLPGVATRLGDAETVRIWRITDVPTTIVVRPDGRVRATDWPLGGSAGLLGG